MLEEEFPPQCHKESGAIYQRIHPRQQPSSAGQIGGERVTTQRKTAFVILTSNREVAMWWRVMVSVFVTFMCREHGGLWLWRVPARDRMGIVAMLRRTLPRPSQALPTLTRVPTTPNPTPAADEP